MTQTFTRLFPLWALVGTALALWQPHWFTGHQGTIVPALAVVMFGMGMTLTLSDFGRALRQPRMIALGVALQFGLMPLAAWGIATALGLAPLLAAGLILVGAAPGGTASNVICYLARGDVALSITLTAVATVLAVVMTPLLTWFYVGERVPVAALEMLWAIARIVLMPVAAGVLINHLLGRHLHRVQSAFPALSVASIAWIIAVVVGLNAGRVEQLAAVVVVAVALHNAIGLLGGYGVAKCLGANEAQARTLAIEVGMQNSGLAVALAIKFFAPAAALPGAVFSVWHNLTGSLLATAWAGRRP